MKLFITLLALLQSMKRLQLERLSYERKQDMTNLIRNWRSSGLPVSVFEENLRALAKDERPKADKVRLRNYGDETSFFATYARGNGAGRSRAAVTRSDAEFLLEVITELKRELPGMNDSPEDAKALLAAAASVLFNDGATGELPVHLQGPLRRALFNLKPETCQQTLL